MQGTGNGAAVDRVLNHTKKALQGDQEANRQLFKDVLDLLQAGEDAILDEIVSRAEGDVKTKLTAFFDALAYTPSDIILEGRENPRQCIMHVFTVPVLVTVPAKLAGCHKIRDIDAVMADVLQSVVDVFPLNARDGVFVAPFLYSANEAAAPRSEFRKYLAGVAAALLGESEEVTSFSMEPDCQDSGATGSICRPLLLLGVVTGLAVERDTPLIDDVLFGSLPGKDDYITRFTRTIETVIAPHLLSQGAQKVEVKNCLVQITEAPLVLEKIQRALVLKLQLDCFGEGYALPITELRISFPPNPVELDQMGSPIHDLTLSTTATPPAVVFSTKIPSLGDTLPQLNELIMAVVTAFITEHNMIFSDRVMYKGKRGTIFLNKISGASC